jgi:hypothetical protein
MKRACLQNWLGSCHQELFLEQIGFLMFYDGYTLHIESMGRDDQLAVCFRCLAPFLEPKWLFENGTFGNISYSFSLIKSSHSLVIAFVLPPTPECKG